MHLFCSNFFTLLITGAICFSIWVERDIKILIEHPIECIFFDPPLWPFFVQILYIWVFGNFKSKQKFENHTSNRKEIGKEI